MDFVGLIVFGLDVVGFIVVGLDVVGFIVVRLDVVSLDVVGLDSVLTLSGVFLTVLPRIAARLWPKMVRALLISVCDTGMLVTPV